MKPQHPLLDPEVIQSLHALSPPGRDLFVELAERFLRQAATVDEIERCFAARGFAAVAAKAQRMKASAEGLGATPLGRLFHQVEEAAAARDVENLLRLLPALAAAFGAVRAEIERRVARAKAG